MLESIRNRSNGPLAKIIIGMIIIPFAFAGVYSYFNVQTSNAIATVNGEEISLAEFDRSYRLQQQNWGENFDKYFNSDDRLQQFRMEVMQQLINQRLSSQAIQNMGLRTSDNQLRKVIMNTAEFKNEAGVFDENRYKMMVQSGGYSTKQYQSARKNDMASSQFFNALKESNFVLKNELELNRQLQNQKRDINYLIIPQDFFLQKVDLSGEEGGQAISSYYEMNKNRFAIPEKVSIQYITISKRDPADITISEGQIADYYQANMSSFESTERRRVAHILVTVASDADSETVAAAELKINDLASRIKAGTTFEDVARDSSDDTTTAESGGDLDWIEEGMMDTAFEEAAFNLTTADSVSSVVKTAFGFHLIKLLEIESGAAKPLAEVKGQIIATLQNQFVEDKFFDLKDSISEQAYEISDSLAVVAEKNNLVVKNTGLFDSQFGIGLPAELQNQPVIIDAAFSDDVLYQGVNSELIELSDGNMVVLRLLEHKLAGLTPLEEVKGQIISLITQQRAKDATESVGSEILTALREGQTPEDVITKLPEGIVTTWQQQSGLGRQGTEIDAQLRGEVFKMPAPNDGNPTFKGVSLGSGDFSIVELTAVTEGATSVDSVADQQFLDYFSEAEIYGYLKYLDANASIKRSLSKTSVVQ